MRAREHFDQFGTHWDPTRRLLGALEGHLRPLRLLPFKTQGALTSNYQNECFPFRRLFVTWDDAGTICHSVRVVQLLALSAEPASEPSSACSCHLNTPIVLCSTNYCPLAFHRRNDGSLS